MPFSPFAWSSRGGAVKRQQLETLRKAALDVVAPFYRAQGQHVADTAEQTAQSLGNAYGWGKPGFRPRQATPGELPSATAARRIAAGFASNDVLANQREAFRRQAPGTAAAEQFARDVAAKPGTEAALRFVAENFPQGVEQGVGGQRRLVSTTEIATQYGQFGVGQPGHLSESDFKTYLEGRRPAPGGGIQVMQGGNLQGSLVPTSVQRATERIPYAGKPLRRLEQQITPLNIALAGVGGTPATVAKLAVGAAAGQVVAGTAGEIAGAPPAVQTGLEIGGGVAGGFAPLIGGGLRRAAQNVTEGRIPPPALPAPIEHAALPSEMARQDLGLVRNPDTGVWEMPAAPEQKLLAAPADELATHVTGRSPLPAEPSAPAETPHTAPVQAEAPPVGAELGTPAEAASVGVTSPGAAAVGQAPEPSLGARPSEAPALPAIGGGEALTREQVLNPSDVGERGYGAAQAIIDTKHQTLLRPGKLTQVPLIKQTLSVINPSVSLDRDVLVAYNARQAAQATLETSFAAARKPAMDELLAAWKAEAPRYAGPANNPFKNTIKDFADNPDFYAASSQRLRDAVTAYDATSMQTLRTSRQGFGVDVQPFSGKPGSFYLPTVAARDSVDEALQKVANSYTSASLSGKAGVTKTRLYDSAYDRWLRNPNFKAETDLGQLTAMHDRALAKVAGNETFRLGAGGKTRLEVMQETHPKLAAKMTMLRSDLQRLQGNATTLKQRLSDRVGKFLEDPDSVSLSELSDSLDVTLAKGRNAGAGLADLQEQIAKVRQEIRALKPAWEGANTEPYVFNQKTFRYYAAEQSTSIDRILQTKLPIGQGLLDAIDEVRLTAFGGDISPLTIQGALGMAASPLNGIKSLPAVLRQVFDSGELSRIAQAEPEMVQRFTVATGRPFGKAGAEFVQRAKGIERLPGGAALNDRLMGAVTVVQYNGWKNDTALLQKIGGKSREIADAEAANTWSTVVPSLNPAERGVSVLQSQLERTPVISTSFMGAPAKLMKDATSGLLKLGFSAKFSPASRWQALTGREQLAVLRMINLIGSLAGVSIGSYILAGKSPEEAAKITFGSTGRFLSVAIPGTDRYVPIGGPFRSFARAVYPQKVGGLPFPIPFAGIPNFARNKLTPTVSRPIELIRNRDYYGRKIMPGEFPENILRGVWYAAEGAMPLSVGVVSEAARTGATGVQQTAIDVAGQLLGTNVREASNYERLQRSWSEAHPSEPFNYALAAREFPDLAPPSAKMQERTQNLAGAEAALLPYAKGVLAGDSRAGQPFRDAFSTYMDQRAQANIDIFGPNQPNQDAISAYFAIKPTVDQFPSADNPYQVDYDAYSAAKEAAKANLTPQQQQQIDLPLSGVQDPDVRAAIEKYQVAKDAYSGLRDISPIHQLSAQEWDAVRTFQAGLQDFKDGLRRSGYTGDIGTRQAAAAYAQQVNAPRKIVEAALALSPGNKAFMRNLDPAYVRYLRDNRAALEPFYGDLYTSQWVTRALGAER